MGWDRNRVPVKLYVITACSRPENLRFLTPSLARAAQGHDVTWHLRFDAERIYVGGQALKNRMLDEITDGWVWILDDDTLVYPDLFARAADVTVRNWTVEAIVVSQKRADGGILLACRENVRVGQIDIGQVILHRDLIGDERIPLTYDGDGIFLEKVLAGANVVFVNDVLSLHNAL